MNIPGIYMPTSSSTTKPDINVKSNTATLENLTKIRTLKILDAKVTI